MIGPWRKAACLVGICFAANVGAQTPADPLRLEAKRSIDEFRAWAQAYDPARAAKTAQAEGLRLAAQHREAMKLLIADDPAAAIANALPYPLRAKLPASIETMIEERIDGQGLLTERIEMYHDHPAGHKHGESGFHRSVRTPAVVVGERRWFSFTHGRRVGVRSLRPVPIHGVAVDGDIAVSEQPWRKVERGETLLAALPAKPRRCDDSARQPKAERLVVSGNELRLICDPDELRALSQYWGLIERDGADGRFAAPKAETQSAYTTGPKTFLYVRARFRGQAVSALPSLQTVTNAANSMRDMMRAFSYSRLPQVTTTYTNVVELPKTALEYGEDSYSILADGVNAARAANSAWNHENHDFYAVRYEGGPGDFAGAAFVGVPGIWIKDDDPVTLAHELGHSLGLLHANAWGPASGLGDPAGAGENWEYGNDYDVLGNGDGIRAHFTASFKERLTWLLDPEYARLWGSGTWSVSSHDVAPPVPAVAALVSGRERLWMPFLLSSQAVPDGSDPNNPRPEVQRGLYWFEHRGQFTDFDRSLHVNLQGGGNRLLDLTPRSRGGKADGGLLIGRTLSDRGLGLHVTPVAKSGTNRATFDVVVNSGGFAGNRAPTVSLSAGSTNVAVGATVTFTGTGNDPDGDPLAWSWDWGDGTFGGTNAASTTRTFAAAGHYRVRAVASDMKGESGSAAVLVTVGSPNTLRASGRVLVGGQPLADVLVSNGQSGDDFRGAYTDSSGNYTITGLDAGAGVLLSAASTGWTISSSFANPLTPTADLIGLNFAASALPVVSVTATDAIAAEDPSDTITFRIARTGATTNMLRVWFDLSGTAFYGDDSSDYTFSTGATRYVEIPSGAAFANLVATPVADALAEPGETVVLELVDGVDYEITYPARAQGLIAGTAGPPNDAFANAIALSGSSATTTGHNRNATLEFLEPPHNGRGGVGSSIWWRWTAPASGPVVVDTTGSAADTLLAVYTGSSLAELVPLVANNDVAAGNTTSRVAFSAQAGVTYRIALASPSNEGNTGDVRLSLALDLSDADLLLRNGFEAD